MKASTTLTWPAFVPLPASLIVGALSSARSATFTDTAIGDSGPSSLREPDHDGQRRQHTAARVINFNISGGGVQTITLAGALPEIAKTVTIDGTTQPGYTGTPLIVIDGNFGDFDRLVINSFFTGTPPGPQIKALCVINCGMDAGAARKAQRTRTS